MGWRPGFFLSVIAIIGGNCPADAQPKSKASSRLVNVGDRPHFFFPPSRPSVPAPHARSWPINPIDAFILARLQAEGLSPNPRADKFTLLRRVTFDLTGLPPTLAEQQAFLRDDSSTDYERVVEGLLAS